MYTYIVVNMYTYMYIVIYGDIYTHVYISIYTSYICMYSDNNPQPLKTFSVPPFPCSFFLYPLFPIIGYKAFS